MYDKFGDRWSKLTFIICTTPTHTVGVEPDLIATSMYNKYLVGVEPDLIATSMYNKYLVGPSIRPICCRCCFIMTNMIKLCSNFHWFNLAFIVCASPNHTLGVVPD